MPPPHWLPAICCWTAVRCPASFLRVSPLCWLSRRPVADPATPPFSRGRPWKGAGGMLLFARRGWKAREVPPLVDGRSPCLLSFPEVGLGVGGCICCRDPDLVGIPHQGAAEAGALKQPGAPSKSRYTDFGPSKSGLPGARSFPNSIFPECGSPFGVAWLKEPAQAAAESQQAALFAPLPFPKKSDELSEAWRLIAWPQGRLTSIMGPTWQSIVRGEGGYDN